MACNSSKSTSDKAPAASSLKSTKSTEFIIQTDTDQIEEVIAAVSDYEIELGKRIAPNINMWLVDVKHEGREEEVIENLKKNQHILNVQTNKNIQGRQ